LLQPLAVRWSGESEPRGKADEGTNLGCGANRDADEVKVVAGARKSFFQRPEARGP
jgi:hypothetical protein